MTTPRDHQYEHQRAIRIALFCAASQFLLTLAVLKAGLALASPAAWGEIKLVVLASTVIYPLVLAHALGLWRRLGLELAKIHPEPVFLASLSTVALFLPWGLRSAPAGTVAGDVAIQLVNAFGEELLFRGVVFALLASLPAWRAILINAVLFGAMHLMHGFMDGDWKAACWKALVTSVCGTMFAAVRHRTGSLWLCVALHMALNLSMIYSAIQTDASESTVFMVERIANGIELAVALYVIVRAQCKKPASLRAFAR